MPFLPFVRDPEAGGNEQPFILSYLGMRQIAGWVGLILPFAVTLGNWPHALEGSISAYYFTRMGAWFVGSLWVISFFMASCRGYDKWDERAGRFAGVFALGVALIPTNICGIQFGWVLYRGWLHWTCAALLFSFWGSCACCCSQKLTLPTQLPRNFAATKSMSSAATPFSLASL